MNGDVFFGWFNKLIQLISENSIIAMDNSSYQWLFVERISNISWQKDLTVSQLDEKKVGMIIIKLNYNV